MLLMACSLQGQGEIQWGRAQDEQQPTMAEGTVGTQVNHYGQALFVRYAERPSPSPPAPSKNHQHSLPLLSLPRSLKLPTPE